MRKFAWFIIVLLAIASIWAILALWIPAVKTGSEIFWSAVLGGAWTLITGAWINLMNLASASGTAFFVYTLAVLILAVFFWAGMRKLWAWGATNRPHLRTPSLKSSTPDLGISSSSSASTPPGATTRPEPSPKNTEATAVPEESTPQKETET